MFFHSFEIYDKWNHVIARHKFFFSWNILIIIVFFSLMAAGMYQSYDMNGVQVMVLFLVSNFYVVMLQVWWRFWGQDTTGGGAYPREGSFERAKETLGLGYFDKDTDVEFSRSNSEGENGQFGESGEDDEEEGQVDMARPYTPFDEDNRKDGERVALGGRGDVSRSLNDTDNFGNDEDGFGKTKGEFGKDESTFGKQI